MRDAESWCDIMVSVLALSQEEWSSNLCPAMKRTAVLASQGPCEANSLMLWAECVFQQQNTLYDVANLIVLECFPTCFQATTGDWNTPTHGSSQEKVYRSRCI